MNFHETKTGSQNRLVIWGVGVEIEYGGMDWEFGISRYKLLYT